MLDPAIEWLEDQARAYDEAHQDPALRSTLPPVPAYLTQPGVEQEPPLTLTTTVLDNGTTAHIAVEGAIPDGLITALNDLAQAFQGDHSGAEAAP
ncbi:hypothetical protein [Streptosporangium sp. NPDC049078]|uniref:hypothetical protein n=1 Tax=Streptosporangium sp. NPDC049078 TaxID=3155767 RepID=UPI00341D5328